jgi:hypothetical protein
MSGETKQRIGDLEAEIARLKAAQLTLRDQFAMAAMHVVGANTAWQRPIDGLEAAQTAYRIADAMMEARNAKD